MKVCHIFICFFLLRLQDGELGPVQAATYREMEGKNISVSCSFSANGRKMYFCKKDCSRENILVETTEYRAQSGRYSIEFDKTGASYVVVVSITELKKSDSGWYRCHLGITGNQHEDFEIVVNYASEPPQPDSSTAATSIQHLSFSPSSPSSPDTTEQSRTSAPPSGVVRSVAVALSITIIVLGAAFLVLFRCSKHKEPSVEMEYATVIKTNRVKTENREEEGENRSPEFHVTETKDEYSLASHPQNTVGEDTLDYSEVHFSTPTTILHNSAPCGNLADSVLYSEPRTDGNSVSQSKNDTPPLYSTITLHQQKQC